MGKSVRKRLKSQEVDALTMQRMLPAAAMFGELRELVIHALRRYHCGARRLRGEPPGAIPGHLVGQGLP